MNRMREYLLLIRAAIENNPEKAADTAKVLGVNFAAISISLANILTAVQIAAVLLSMAYTVWKWTHPKQTKDE